MWQNRCHQFWRVFLPVSCKANALVGGEKRKGRFIPVLNRSNGNQGWLTFFPRNACTRTVTLLPPPPPPPQRSQRKEVCILSTTTVLAHRVHNFKVDQNAVRYHTPGQLESSASSCEGKEVCLFNVQLLLSRAALFSSCH